MNLEARIDAIFPKETAIPQEHHLPDALEQREFLVDGEIRTWDGPQADVHSPLCISGPTGVEQKVLIVDARQEKDLKKKLTSKRNKGRFKDAKDDNYRHGLSDGSWIGNGLCCSRRYTRCRQGV